MYCEFYLDVFFAVNLLLDFLILCLTNLILKGTANPLRALLGGILGAAGMCLFVVFSMKIHTGETVMFFGIMAAVMVRTGCGCKSPRTLFLGCCTFWGGAFLTGGLLSALPYETRKGTLVFLAITITAYWILYIGIRLCKYLKGKAPLLCGTVVALQGREVKATGLYDTGNRLQDGVTGKPVSVMEFGSFSRLLSLEQREALERFCSMKTEEADSRELLSALNPRFLLYTSVGCQRGLLPVVTADRLTIFAEGEKKQVESPAIGLSMETLSPKGNYEIIMSSAIWER